MKRLKIVKYEGKRYFFDEKLKQLRSVAKRDVEAIEFIDLNDFEVEYFKNKKGIKCA